MKLNSLVIFILLCPTYLFGQSQPLNNSFVAFTVQEKDLLPENIAYDKKEEAFYIGSTRKGKIIKIFKNGDQEVFLESGRYGQWMIIGMKIDPERRILWACSSGGGNLVGYSQEDDKEGRPAGIFKFNLDTGELIKKYTFTKQGEVHFFNDIVLAKNGDVFITHMFKDPAIYTISKRTDNLEPLFSGEGLRYPNGLTLSEDEKYLFIAHSNGISRLDIGSGNLHPLNKPGSLKISGAESIDGLYYYQGSLIGVQSDIETVQRFTLNENMDEIISSELLEVGHPMMDHPTTGVIADSQFYYIANAQFERFNEDGTLFPDHKLYEPVVLKVELK